MNIEIYIRALEEEVDRLQKELKETNKKYNEAKNIIGNLQKGINNNLVSRAEK